MNQAMPWTLDFGDVSLNLKTKQQNSNDKPLLCCKGRKVTKVWTFQWSSCVFNDKGGTYIVQFQV